jgi:hypothetical protein
MRRVTITMEVGFPSVALEDGLGTVALGPCRAKRRVCGETKPGNGRLAIKFSNLDERPCLLTRGLT